MKKNKHIFISRALAPDSVFLQMLSDVGCTVEGLSLVAFQRHAFTDFPQTDWIFFYSAKAAAYFLEGLQDVDKSWSAQTQIATIGPGTANWLIGRGIKVDFIGNGAPEWTSQQFIARAAGQRVLFPQAKLSRNSIAQLAGEALQSEPLIVYDNSPKKDFDLIPPDVLTFTSPLNAEAYFTKYPEKAKPPIVVIGETTRRAVEQLGQVVAAVASQAGEAALAEAVLTCLE